MSTLAVDRDALRDALIERLVVANTILVVLEATGKDLRLVEDNRGGYCNTSGPLAVDLPSTRARVPLSGRVVP